MEKLTVKQAACLAAIADHWQRHNRPPTVAQIAIRLGMDECRSKGYANGPITTGQWELSSTGIQFLKTGEELARVLRKKTRKRA
jgi:hypothetical protein